MGHTGTGPMNTSNDSSPTEQNSDLSDLLAFGVEIDHHACIVFALNKQKAKWIAVRGYREAGYCGDREWPPGVKVWRETRYDNCCLRQERAQAWTEDHVRDMM